MLQHLADNHADPAIQVSCDRCRAIGDAGEGDFADLKDLLRFTPVPRKSKRFDGWTPERQQAFIVALAATGSVRRPAHTIGMAQFGAEQLRKAEGSDEFIMAWERAMAIAEEDRAARLAHGLAEARPRGRAKASRSAPGRQQDDEVDSERHAALQQEGQQRILETYVRKLVEERACRLEGRIAAADFALRQLTVIELVLDSGDIGLMALLERTRFGDSLCDIADTPATRLLDELRREHWRLQDEPERPSNNEARLVACRSAGVVTGNILQMGPVEIVNHCCRLQSRIVSVNKPNAFTLACLRSARCLVC